MSLATVEPREQKFLARFENVWASLRRFQVARGLCWSLLAVTAGLTLLAWADFAWELSRTTRLAGLAGLGLFTLAILASRVVAPWRWWTRPRTAVEIEKRFPLLGQRIRTVVQYGGLPEALVHSEGVAPSLVEALEEETDIQVRPLPIDRLVPWGRARAIAVLAVLPALGLLILAAGNVEWRIALRRVFLSPIAYTTIQVAPGNVRIEQGESVPVTVELKGRVQRDVVLYTRPESRPDAPWKAVELPKGERGPDARRATILEKVKDPIAYRVVAGPAQSPVYKVSVRYPLTLTTFQADVRPPAYTRVKPGTVKGGDLQVIEGTEVTLRISFDARPSEVALIVTDPLARPKKDTPDTASKPIPLRDEGSTYSAALTLDKSLYYRIEARTADGRLLPKNKYKIDVHEDRAPRVSFDEPDEALEVHPLAEVKNRIRASDDFGLTRAGIVFQFNNGEEQTLIVSDFDPKAEKPTTSAALEETLLLEKLAASPTDSLTYYAFAEDNYPKGAKRAETDLRFLDIRPFKREYKASEPGSGMEGTDEFVTLTELIARQRFNLTRAKRLASHKPADKVPADDPLKIAGFEETLVNLIKEFTEGVEGVVNQRVEPLHQAEEAMLASVEALDRGKNAEAPPHMSEAVRRLIEVRDTLRVLIGNDSALARMLRQFDRSQAQKIRKPKKEAEEAEAIAAEIEQLADDEDFVYATLAAMANPAPAPGDSPAPAGTGDPKEPKEPKEGEKPEPKEDGPKGEKGQARQDAPKGDGKGKPTAGDKPGAGDKPEDKEGGVGPKKDDRRDAIERQEKIADMARDIEERLKKLEAASNLAKARMAKAAETTEKAAGALARGGTKEAKETAKAGAAMLHELARQVKGELAKEVADELAMARDLAEELAEREAELGRMADQKGDPGAPGQGEKGEPTEPGPGTKGQGGTGLGDLTVEERLERINEAAKTLEELLKGAAQRAEGPSAEKVRELLEETPATEIVERVGELYLGGKTPEAKGEARDLAKTFEALASRLDTIHRGIVAPELAALVETDRRVEELMDRLKELRTNAEITEWHRQATALIRDLEKAGLNEAAATLTEVLNAGGWVNGPTDWHWGGTVPVAYTNALRAVVKSIQDKIQDMILKDLVSARDEATPPEFKELVERYYEVLSKQGAARK